MRRTVAAGLVAGAVALSIPAVTHARPIHAGRDGSEPPPPATQPSPMTIAEQTDSAWEYLRRRYDANEDGRIEPEEYDRAGGRFDRLDRNEDGVLTAEDFQSRRGGADREEMMRRMRSQQLVARYFQADENSQELPLAELERAFDAYDANHDGKVGHEEFAAVAEDRKVTIEGGNARMLEMAMQGMEPWEALVDGLDADKDGSIGRDELIEFFKSRDDGDLVWTMRARGGGNARRGGGRQPAMTGPAEGEEAPDFTLQPPDGGDPVTLSAFREKNLPVALIFGSYT